MTSAAWSDPKVASYLRAFDAWLAAGDDRNRKLVRDLRDVCADDLIGDRPRRRTPFHLATAANEISALLSVLET